MHAPPFVALLLLGVATSCLPDKKTGDAGSTCASDSDCKNGLLCESRVCVPKDVAEKARAATAAVATTATAAPTATATATVLQPAPTPEPAPVVDEGPIPLIPTERSNPPQGNEWLQGKEVNTQNVHSQPDKCEMRVLREWLQVTCREHYVGYEKMENFGQKFSDYYESVDPGRVVSFVLRLKKGKTQAVRICAPDKRASLFVNWPPTADRPAHIALGKGPACDGSEWGAYLKKKVPLKPLK